MEDEVFLDISGTSVSKITILLITDFVMWKSIFQSTIHVLLTSKITHLCFVVNI